MPQSPDVVRHAAFCAPLWRSGVSETQAGAVSGGMESSKPGLTTMLGPTGPSESPVVRPTLSKTAALSTVGSWLVTAKPPAIGEDIATVTDPTAVHDCPSGESSPVN